MQDKYLKTYNTINGLSYDDWEKRCILINDCSKCNMALHKDLFSVTKHTCIYGISLAKYQTEIEKCDAYII